jgi:hypothetical protein
MKGLRSDQLLDGFNPKRERASVSVKIIWTNKRRNCFLINCIFRNGRIFYKLSYIGGIQLMLKERH